VKHHNALRFKENFSEAAIINNHYIDEYVHCFHDEQEAIRITKQAVGIHKKGGFDLRGFISNSQICRTADANEETALIVNLDRHIGIQYQKVLENIEELDKMTGRSN